MSPSIRRAVLLLALLLAGPSARAEEKAFSLKTASPELRAGVEKFRAELQILGFRFDDDTGQLLSPKTHKPAPSKEVEEFLARIQLERRQMAVARVEELLQGLPPDKPVPADVAARIDDIVKDMPGLPADLVKILQGARVSKAGDVRAKAQASMVELTRLVDGEEGFWGAAGSAFSTPGGWSRKPVLPGYQSADERALGERVSKAAVEYFGRFDTGKELLAHFSDGKGRVVLPEMMVLKVQDFAAAFYSAGNRAMVCNFGPVRDAILERAPETQRDALNKKLQTAKDLNDYLAKDPGAIRAFLEANDVTLYHELTHAWQDKRGRLPSEQLRGNAVGNDPLEGEWEAFTNQNRFMHEKLLKDPDAAMKNPYFDEYRQMLADYDQFTDAITRQYLQLMPSGAATLPDMRSLQRRRVEATKTTMKEDVVSFLRGALKLIGLSHGGSALEQAQDDYQARRDSFKKDELPRMRVEGQLAMARAYMKGGEWNQAVRAAYQAELDIAGKPSAKTEVQGESDQIAAAALAKIQAGDGSVEDRAQALYALAQRKEKQGRGPDIPPDLRAKTFLGLAEDYLKRAEKSTDASARKQLLAAAKGWVNALGKDKPEDFKDASLGERLKALRFETQDKKP